MLGALQRAQATHETPPDRALLHWDEAWRRSPGGVSRGPPDDQEMQRSADRLRTFRRLDRAPRRAAPPMQRCRWRSRSRCRILIPVADATDLATAIPPPLVVRVVLIW
jgi:hypothetical protein